MTTINKLARNNDFDGVKTFIQEAKAEKGQYWCSHNYRINSACRAAVHLGHERIVQLFLDEGLDPNTTARPNKYSLYLYPLTHFAAKVGNLPMVKLLVSKGAKIQDEHYFRDECDNQDAMRIAISGGRADVVQYLLENGGSADDVFKSFFYRETFLGRAAFNSQKPITNLLVKHGARIKIALSLNDEKFRRSCEGYEKAISNYNNQNRAWQLQLRSKTEMQDWDQEKQELIDKRDVLLRKHSNSVQLLLDHAIGTNLDKEKKRFFDDGAYGGLTFLKGLDITGCNFVGVSVGGRPITREMLEAQGLKCADKAIITYDDITHMEEEERRDALMARLKTTLQSQGEIISAGGIVNLVPLADGAEKGNLTLVQVRLSAGIDPNQMTTDTANSTPAIVAAAKKGFLEVVKALAEHPKIDQKTLPIAAQEARINRHYKIAEYLNLLIAAHKKNLIRAGGK